MKEEPKKEKLNSEGIKDIERVFTQPVLMLGHLVATILRKNAKSSEEVSEKITSLAKKMQKVCAKEQNGVVFFAAMNIFMSLVDGPLLKHCEVAELLGQATSRKEKPLRGDATSEKPLRGDPLQVDPLQGDPFGIQRVIDLLEKM